MKKYKIRFNLGRGENYLKWKVTSPNGAVNYYEPNKASWLTNKVLLKRFTMEQTRLFVLGLNVKLLSFKELSNAHLKE